jgi:penicillin-binding protein 2
MLICGATMMVLFCVLYTHLLSVSLNDTYAQLGEEQFYYQVDLTTVYGNIYDSNLNLLVNDTTKLMAVVNPTPTALEELSNYVVDSDELLEKASTGVPFAIEVTKSNFTSSDVHVYTVPQRYSKEQLAKHLIGYTSDGVGVTGLELSYDEYLHESETTYSVKVPKDGLGGVIDSIPLTATGMVMVTSGVVTTLDSKIQELCEYAMQTVDKGACIVTDISTGEIKAMVSVPTFDLANLEVSLDDDDLPFIDRTLSEYSCGSIFKLVTSGVALDSGISEGYTYECTGEIDILTQKFKCHKLDGHGVQTMCDAMVNSCNTYYISLIQSVDSTALLNACSRLGFGRETVLAKNVVSSSGYVPTESQLQVPAEKANFAFGQGYLMVTPLQISSLTCAIANGGNMPILYVVKGKTEDGSTLYDTHEPMYTRVFSESTAKTLQEFMNRSVQYNTASNGVPCNTTAGGKTSTAQTGKYGEDGVEVCQSWITGYFPCDNPKYAVTVLVEDGGYGNVTSAPIFKRIIELVTAYSL